MFVCSRHDKLLTPLAKTWPWLESIGKCEICGRQAVCKDVSSQYDWAWAPLKRSKKKGRKHAKTK